MNAPEPGLYPGVPENEYRSWDAANQSTLWTFRRSALHARYEYLHPDATPDTDLGSAIHAACLEPGRIADRYAVRPPGIDRRTREGKVAWAQFEAESAGKTILARPDDFATLEGVADAVRNHPLAFELLCTAPGATEVSSVWRDPELDVLCKGRIDRIVEYAGWTWLVDLKSAQDASPQGFLRSVLSYGYHVQASFYVDGLEALDPRDRRFAFVVVEKSPPYAVACYELDMLLADLGRAEYRRYLKMWKRCQESGVWDGYPNEIAVCTAPDWVAKRLEYFGPED